MGKSSPSPPAAPDPAATSAAQTASNQATALYNAGLNNPTTTTPLGTSTYTIDSSNPNQPTSTQNITLSPVEQKLFDQSNQNILQQGQTAGTALNNVTGLFNTPYNLQGNVPSTLSGGDQQKDLQNAQNALYGQQTQYLDPQFQQAQQQLDSQLANQGIVPGSAAYQTAEDNQARQKQQAYQSAMNQATSGGAAYQAQLAQTGLANQAQQAQLYTQQYQEPLSLYSSLISGTQPTLPQFAGANTSQAAPTNVLGAYQNAYNGQLNNYNTQVGSANSQLGGAASLLGSLGSAAIMSDRRLKKNIEKIGITHSGLNVYRYTYIWENEAISHVGVMADEVQQVLPQAVLNMSDGYQAVDYSQIQR